MIHYSTIQLLLLRSDHHHARFEIHRFLGETLGPRNFRNAPTTARDTGGRCLERAQATPANGRAIPPSGPGASRMGGTRKTSASRKN